MRETSPDIIPASQGCQTDGRADILDQQNIRKVELLKHKTVPHCHKGCSGSPTSLLEYQNDGFDPRNSAMTAGHWKEGEMHKRFK